MRIRITVEDDTQGNMEATAETLVGPMEAGKRKDILTHLLEQVLESVDHAYGMSNWGSPRSEPISTNELLDSVDVIEGA